MKIKANSVGDLPIIVKDEYGNEFKQDYHARKILCKMFEADFRAVYRALPLKNDWDDNNVILDTEEFYVVTRKNKVLCFTNSEWGAVSIDNNVETV